jgi:hypothetical protein
VEPLRPILQFPEPPLYFVPFTEGLMEVSHSNMTGLPSQESNTFLRNLTALGIPLPLDAYTANISLVSTSIAAQR